MDEDFEVGEFVVFSPRTEAMERHSSRENAEASMEEQKEWPPLVLFQVLAVVPGKD